ncbi:uncharacterized protein LOC128222890 [Mya arenaria]|uniref:uncharacterized protein LOC128222890 n=1 Tax=Mya arenaria TaxID=6604 RepID=UPI0022E244C0|nr:uncharacterized protein LOC128222890 [Mya arenaria]
MNQTTVSPMDGSGGEPDEPNSLFIWVSVGAAVVFLDLAVLLGCFYCKLRRIEQLSYRQARRGISQNAVSTPTSAHTYELASKDRKRSSSQHYDEISTRKSEKVTASTSTLMVVSNPSYENCALDLPPPPRTNNGKSPSPTKKPKIATSKHSHSADPKEHCVYENLAIKRNSVLALLTLEITNEFGRRTKRKSKKKNLKD